MRTEAVGLLAAGLAHDLNNMLGAIVATAELMAGRHAPASENFRDLAAITAQATRAGALIHQILAFSRQEILKPAATSFAEMLNALGSTLEALASGQARLHIAPGAAVPVYADPAALERVIVNLVLNARDAFAVQGRLGTIRMETGRATAADLPAAAPFMAAGDYGWLSVSDDGPGISPVHAARIFEPYFTTRAQGQGLGLATAYGIVKQSGGYLVHDEGRFGGARFTIFLPHAERDARAVSIPREAVVRPLLLLAEDENLLRLSATRALEAAGFSVKAAASGEAALAAYDTAGEIAALVSDIRLGGMDGIELALALRRRTPDLPIMLISGYADEAARTAVANLDCAFLAKPFRLRELTTGIAAILRTN